VLIFSYKIDLSLGTAKVPLQDTISQARQFLCGQTFTCPAQTLACRSWFPLDISSIVVY
jgi:hypothetical protein